MHSTEVRTIFYKAPVKVATEVFYKTKAVLKNSAIFNNINSKTPVNVTKSLRTHILKKICKQLLLQIRTTAFECL